MSNLRRIRLTILNLSIDLIKPMSSFKDGDRVEYRIKNTNEWRRGVIFTKNTQTFKSISMRISKDLAIGYFLDSNYEVKYENDTQHN